MNTNVTKPVHRRDAESAEIISVFSVSPHMRSRNYLPRRD